jgi:hypothetical protein
MREQLEKMSYQQLLKIARAYNLSVSVALPQNISKDDLITNILRQATDMGKLIAAMGSARASEDKPTLPKVKRTPSMSDDEFAALEKRRARGMRKLERAALITEPLEGQRSKAEEKDYKSRVKKIKAEYKAFG